jgi:hypothetical protein
MKLYKYLNSCLIYLSWENEPGMEFVNGDQLGRRRVEAGRQARQRIAILHRVSQRVFRQPTNTATSDTTTTAASAPLSASQRTARPASSSSTSVCSKIKNEKTRKIETRYNTLRQHHIISNERKRKGKDEPFDIFLFSFISL